MITEQETKVLEWQDVLDRLLQKAMTGPGKERIQALRPLSAEEAKEQLQQITELKRALLENIVPDFSGTFDIIDLTAQAAKGSLLSLDDIFKVRQTTTAYARVEKFLRTYQEELPSFLHIQESFCDLSGLNAMLRKAVTDDAALNGSTFPKIGSIQRDIQRIKNDIEARIQKLVHSSTMDTIVQEKIYTTRNDRYVILIKSNMKGKIQGTVQDISASGATLYLEPASLIPLNSSLLMKHYELEREIQKILADISSQIGEVAPEIAVNQEHLAEMDFLTAAARFSRDLRANAPEILATPSLELYAARHPLLFLMAPDSVIANDVSLGNDYSCLVITGANTGGKTVLLKTIGLCVLMAAHGLHIPASADSKIGIFKKILADIGDDQNLAQSLSTYSGQIVMLREMLKKADSATLLLIDEIISGTNPHQGAALARAVLEKMVATDCKIVVTTHYQELKELASHNDRFMNASVSFDLDTLKPTYQLKTGIPGISYTLEIARNYQIPDDVISRAQEFLSDNELSTEALIEKIQRYEQEISEERQKISQLRQSLSDEQDKYEAMKQTLEEKIQQANVKEGIAFIDELQAYRQEIANKIRSLQQADITTAGNLQQEIIALETSISEEVQQLKEDSIKGEQYLTFDPQKAHPGDKVFVIALEKEATIDSIDHKKGSVTVLFGKAIRSRYKFKELLLSSQQHTHVQTKEKHYTPHISKKQNNSDEIPITIQTSYNTIDLRGKYVDTALDFLESTLDKMLRSNVDRVVIIHGHGTGALKDAVRKQLPFSSYVSAFRAGSQAEGGDGVTIARLIK